MAWTDGTRRISREELLTWTRASNLPEYRSAGWSDRIIDWLKNGALEGVATDCQWQNGPQNLSTGPIVLAASWWGNVDSGHPSHYANLWKNADIHLYVPDPASGAITKVHFKGVRLEPNGLELALDETVPLPAPAQAEPEAFKHWLTPAEALDRLPDNWGEDRKQKAVATKLEDGLLNAAAATVVSKSGETRRWAVFLPDAWRRWAYYADDDFWETGTFAGLTSDSTGYGRIEASKVRAHDVRLDPDGIAAMVPRAAAPRSETLRSPERGASKPITVMAEAALTDAPNRTITPHRPSPAAKVRISDLRTWYVRQFAENPHLPFRRVEAMAQAYFAPLRVTRQPLRDIISEFNHTHSQGNPQLAKKIGE